MSLDVDIVIEGDAIAFARRMQSLYGGRVIEHKRFGTAKWQLKRAHEPVNVPKLLARHERTWPIPTDVWKTCLRTWIL